jgi:hypothetical protein
VIPEPMITTSAFVGKCFVVRCPRRSLEGWVCQNEAVDVGLGRLARPEGITSIVMVGSESNCRS